MKNIVEHTILLNVKVEKLFALLSDISNYERLFDGDVKDWKVDGDVCSFVYDESTPAKLKIFDRKPFDKIVIGTYGRNSIDFDLEFLMMDVGLKGTNFKMTVKVDMNPIMASMITSSMETMTSQFLEALQKEITK